MHAFVVAAVLSGVLDGGVAILDAAFFPTAPLTAAAPGVSDSRRQDFHMSRGPVKGTGNDEKS